MEPDVPPPLSNAPLPRKARRALGCAIVILGAPVLAITVITVADIHYSFLLASRVNAALAAATEISLKPGAEPGTLTATTQLHFDIPEGAYRFYARLPDDYHERGRLSITSIFSASDLEDLSPRPATLQGDHGGARIAWLSAPFFVPNIEGKRVVSIRLTLRTASSNAPPSHLLLGIGSAGDLADYAGIVR